MAKECIEYKLHRNSRGHLTTPSWMSDGGYFQNPADKTMVGFVPVQGERNWFVPDSVTILTEQEFVTRCMAMHNTTPFQSVQDMTPMTNAEADEMLRQFYQSKVA